MTAYWTNKLGFSITDFEEKRTPNAPIAIGELIVERIKEHHNITIDSLKLLGKVQMLLLNFTAKASRKQVEEGIILHLVKEEIFRLVEIQELKALVRTVMANTSRPVS